MAKINICFRRKRKNWKEPPVLVRPNLLNDCIPDIFHPTTTHDVGQEQDCKRKGKLREMLKKSSMMRHIKLFSEWTITHVPFLSNVVSQGNTCITIHQQVPLSGKSAEQNAHKSYYAPVWKVNKAR